MSTPETTPAQSTDPSTSELTIAAPAPPAPLVFISPPPSDVSIPRVEYESAASGEFKNVVPCGMERTALAQALEDLTAFATYQQALGTSAPPHAEVVQTLRVASQWTNMRALAANWDGYCIVQEGLAWRAVRQLMTQLVPVFALAAVATPALLTQFPGLASLLGAKKSIGKKGASTRRLNKKAIAEGREPVHGLVGKRRLRRIEKAAAVAAGAPVAPRRP